MAAINATAAQVIQQLRDSQGNITHAAGKLDTSRRTLHAYINTHPTVADALADVRESTKDRGETMLQSRMATSDTLLIFYLKTQAHDRGYGDKSELKHSGYIGATADERARAQQELDEWNQKADAT